MQTRSSWTRRCAASSRPSLTTREGRRALAEPAPAESVVVAEGALHTHVGMRPVAAGYRAFYLGHIEHIKLLVTHRP